MFQIPMPRTFARRTVSFALAVFLLAAVPALACGPSQVPVEEDAVQISQQHPAPADLFGHVRTERTSRLDTDG